MEGAEAPSDNAVSSVTLTTAASTSNVLIMNFFARKLAEACSPFLARPVQLWVFCLHHSLLTPTTRVKYNMQISTATLPRAQAYVALQ